VAPPAAAVFGVAAVAWSSPPTDEELVAATRSVAALAAALAEPTEARAPFCGCAGNAVVDAPADSEFVYGPVAGSGLPTAECAARVASTTAIGIDLSPLLAPAAESAQAQTERPGAAIPDLVSRLSDIMDRRAPRRRRARSRRALQQFDAIELKYCSSPLIVDGGAEGEPGPFDPSSQEVPPCAGPICVFAEDNDYFLEGDVFFADLIPDLPCAPVSFDTFARQPCSSPPVTAPTGFLAIPFLTLPPGVPGAPGVDTCGVESSFRAGGGAGAPTAACLLLQVTLPVSPEPLADLHDPCAGAPGAALDNAPCMPITNANENANENTNALLNDNTNLAENTNAQTVGNEAAGGASGDSASSSAANPNTAVGNAISISVGAAGR
jgi:hypothetical protein